MENPGAKPPPPPRATYADLEAVPSIRVAELIAGVLYTFPRPASPHARAATVLTSTIGRAFDLGREDGPGGWHILFEPELHFPDPTEAGTIDALVPNLAGWRHERMPRMPDVAAFTLVPDWVCEVVSMSTAELDRTIKMPVYAREGARHAWLVDPIERTLEVYALDASGRWSEPVRYQGEDRVRAAPFEALELDLTWLWI